MNKNKIQKLEKSILALMKEMPGVPISRRQISHALSIHKADYHLFQMALDALVSDGRLTKGKKNQFILQQKTKKMVGELRTTRAGFGFVNFEDQDFEVFVAQPNLNTAFDRDIVEVQLYAVSRGKRLEGFVKKVRQRFRTEIVGTYHKTEYYSYVVPDDPRVYRDIIVQAGRALDARDGQKVLVRFDRWERNQHNPEGTIVEVLGDPGDPGVDVVSVAYSYNLPVKFPRKVESEAGRITDKIPAEEIKQRLDLRKQICFTIDPADARDFDDAVSITRLDNGNWELGVHIADVSYYVKEGTLLDAEAFKRGTSVYMVDRVIPMLPEKLSNEICSLRPDEDRLTYSCIMEVGRDTEVLSYRILPSIIRSKRRFTYEEVQDILDGRIDDPLAGVLKDMDRLRDKLMRKRFEQGGIDFETPEVRFVLDERGQPQEIIPKKRLNSHRLVEEFMLLANQTVARHISNISPDKGKKLPFIYRVHEKPDPEKMQKFFDFLAALQVHFKPVKRVTSKFFQEILASIKGTKEEIVIEEVALRSMMKAVYSDKNIGHFGLGFQDYTHFTSPIRRYPDLTVHRLLRSYDQNGRSMRGETRARIKKIAEQATKMERLAVEAERESIKLKQAEYINRYIGEKFVGVVSGVTAFGIFVELKDTFIEGMVPIERLEDDFYIFDEKSYSLIGRDFDGVIRLGDEVEIVVESVLLEKKQIEFSLVQNLSDEPGRSGQHLLSQKNDSRPARRKRRRR